MRWRRTDPVQEVGAAILIAPDAADAVTRALAGRPALRGALPVQFGDGWAAVFAAPLADGPPGDRLLPRLPAATPLHEAAPGWWLPVGVRLDGPDHAAPALWQGLAAAGGAQPPAIVIPRFQAGETASAEADLYLVPDPAPLAAPAGAGADA